MSDCSRDVDTVPLQGVHVRGLTRRNLGIVMQNPGILEIPTGSSLSIIADFLQDNFCIGKSVTRHSKYPRCVNLRLPEMFTALVALYSTMFLCIWTHLQMFVEAQLPNNTKEGWNYVAGAYISAWIHDLYVSNREAVRKLALMAFHQHYQEERVYYSNEYDEFLCLVNADIRPTHITGTPEDTLYIPVLAERIYWNKEDNPFGIEGYLNEYELVRGLIGVLRERKLWKMSTLSDNTTGRPFWLLDLHATSKFCAWFPMEGNFNMEDVTIAYIIGVACTPNLGMRDIDDWTPFPNGVLPGNVNANTLVRTNARGFFGGYEYRIYQTRQVYVGNYFPEDAAVSKKHKAAGGKSSRTVQTTSEPGASEPAESSAVLQASPNVVHQYQIIDWTYYYLVVRNMDDHTRYDALSMIISK